MTSQLLDRPHWLTALRRFTLFTLLGHLLWEVAHIPLYTIWVEGTWGEIVFAVVHCTGGDLLIAMSSLLLALFSLAQAHGRRRGSIPSLARCLRLD